MILILKISIGIVLGNMFWALIVAVTKTWVIPFFMWLDRIRKEDEQK